jgi:integrase
MHFQQDKASGVYHYRRRVPKELQSSWGKKQVKVSLKTKSKNQANLKAARLDIEFEEKLAFYKKRLSGSKLTNRETLEHAKEILIKEGIHPQQVPNNKEEAIRFFDKIEEYKELYMHIMPGITEINTPNGVGWDTDYEIDQNNPYYQTLIILEGRETLNIVPTLKEITEGYLKDGVRSGKRTEWNEKKHAQKTWRAIKALAPLDTPINEITRIKAKLHLDKLRADNPTWSESTIRRAIKSLNAIFNSAIREYSLNSRNPFEGLGVDKLIKINSDIFSGESDEGRRRSMTKQELDIYEKYLLTADVEISLIGRFVIQSGCRPSEIAGILIEDCKLHSNVPHIQIRYNRIRHLKTKNSARDIPIVGSLLDEFRDFVAKRIEVQGTGALFRYGKDGKINNINSAMKTHHQKMKKELGILDDKECVPYSARHSMKDKLRVLKTPIQLQHSILGNGEKRISEGYGDGNPLSYLQTEIIKASELTSWGLEY